MERALLLGVVVLVLLTGVLNIPNVMASDVGDQRDFIYGWRDAYNNWAHLAKYPDDEDSHNDWYWQGVDAGWKYARAHVKVVIIQGHILSDENASAYMDGWFSGQYAHWRGFGRNAPDSIFAQYDQGFYDGYDAPYPTLPAVASEHN
jgi:hypothetical protein